MVYGNSLRTHLKRGVIGFQKYFVPILGTLLANLIIKHNSSEPSVEIKTLMEILTGTNSKFDTSKFDLTNTYLVGLTLYSPNLSHAKLNEANLTDIRLEGANLTGTRLTGADLTSAWLNGANLTGAMLNKSKLTGASLKRANLTKLGCLRQILPTQHFDTLI